MIISCTCRTFAAPFTISACVHVHPWQCVASCKPPANKAGSRAEIHASCGPSCLVSLFTCEALLHLLTYCWWKKSCTSRDVKNHVNCGINYLSTGAGFLPSSVSGEIHWKRNPSSDATEAIPFNWFCSAVSHVTSWRCVSKFAKRDPACCPLKESSAHFACFLVLFGNFWDSIPYIPKKTCWPF